MLLIQKDTIYGSLGMLPNLGVDFHFWGLGGRLEFGGPQLAAVGRILAGLDRANAGRESHKGNQASKTSSFERRAEDWTLQSNLAAKELIQIGKQIVSSLLREQIASFSKGSLPSRSYIHGCIVSCQRSIITAINLPMT